MSGISGAEIRTTSGTKMTSVTTGTEYKLYVPSNGGTTSTRTVTISISATETDSCSNRGVASSSGLTASCTVRQSGDTASFVCYKYDGTTLTKASSSWNPYVTGSSGIASSSYGYATLTLKRTPKYQWNVAGTTYYGTAETDTTTSCTVSGSRCTPANSSGTKLTSVKGGDKIYLYGVTSNTHYTSAKTVSLTVTFPSLCSGENSTVTTS